MSTVQDGRQTCTKYFVAWAEADVALEMLWSRTSGVNATGAAGKVMTFDRLGKKATPWRFWEHKNRLTGVPKTPLCQTN